MIIAHVLSFMIEILNMVVSSIVLFMNTCFVLRKVAWESYMDAIQNMLYHV